MTWKTPPRAAGGSETKSRCLFLCQSFVDYGTMLLSLPVPMETSFSPSFLHPVLWDTWIFPKTSPANPIYLKWGHGVLRSLKEIIHLGLQGLCKSLRLQVNVFFFPQKRFSKASVTPPTPPLTPHHQLRCSMVALQEAGSGWKNLFEVFGVFSVHRSQGSGSVSRSCWYLLIHSHPLVSFHSGSLSSVGSALTLWASQQPWESPDWCLNYSALFQLQVSLNRREYLLALYFGGWSGLQGWFS